MLSPISAQRHSFNKVFAIATFVALCLTLSGPLFMIGNIVFTGSQALWHTKLVLPASGANSTTDAYDILQESLNRLLPLKETPALEQELPSIISDAAEGEIARHSGTQPMRISLTDAAHRVLQTALPTWTRQSYNLLAQGKLQHGNVHFVGLPRGLITHEQTHSVLLIANRGVGKVIAHNDAEVIVQPLLPFAQTQLTNFTLLHVPQQGRSDNLSDTALAMLDALQRGNVLEKQFNTKFFFGSDSRLPEMAGIFSSMWGTLFTLVICVIMCVPTGIAAAVWLEEQKSAAGLQRRLATFAELNIANAASIPSVIYGLLGAAVFLQGFGMARSSPLVGGCVLSLIMLPIVIAATREALRNVPLSLKNSALALGATPLQAMVHHVLPAASGSILTGVLLGVARVAGESAPLLLIGMAAFVPSMPHDIFDAAATLPTQIFLWSDSPERGFVAKTAAAAAVLIFMIFCIQLPLLLTKKRTKD